MATVVAAVDLARVRQPVHLEGGEAEEEEPVELELEAQAEKHIVQITNEKREAAEAPAAVTSETVLVTQVGIDNLTLRSFRTEMSV